MAGRDKDDEAYAEERHPAVEQRIRSQAEARAEFWRALEKHASVVAESLRDEVFPVWREEWRPHESLPDPPGNDSHWNEFLAHMRAQADLETAFLLSKLAPVVLKEPRAVLTLAEGQVISRAAFLSGQPVSVSESDDRALTPGQQALLYWAVRWRLTEFWCLATVEQTLHSWCLAGVPTPLVWAPVHHDILDRVFGSKIFKFVYPAWSPKKETWKEWAQRVKSAFDHMIEEHRRQQGATIPKQDHFSVVTKGRLVDYSRWLVKYHFLGQTFEQIANDEPPRKEDPPGAGMIQNAVQRFCSFLPLPLRPRRQGRPTRRNP
jgi:hypothetical protein